MSADFHLNEQCLVQSAAAEIPTGRHNSFSCHWSVISQMRKPARLGIIVY